MMFITGFMSRTRAGLAGQRMEKIVVLPGSVLEEKHWKLCWFQKEHQHLEVRQILVGDEMNNSKSAISV